MSKFSVRSISCERIEEFGKILHMHWPRPVLGCDCYIYQFSLIYNRVWSLNFISAQYLEKEKMELDQILQMHWIWPGLCWDCFMSGFATIQQLWLSVNVRILSNLQQNYGLWLSWEFHFCSVSWGQIDGIRPNFAYALPLVDQILVGIVTHKFLQTYKF